MEKSGGKMKHTLSLTIIRSVLLVVVLALPMVQAEESGTIAVDTALPGEKKVSEWRKKDLLPPKRELINSSGFKTAFYTPAKGTGPWQPVVLLSGSQGGMIRGKRVNQLIAAGYCVITPEYLGFGEDLISIPLEFFDKTLAWLQNDPRVVQGGVAVVGGSKGGELALLLASRKEEIRVVVGIVPSSYVSMGIARRYHSSSSWSYAGEDLPYLPYSGFHAMIAAMTSQQFLKVYTLGWNKRANYPEARIPLEKSNAAVLLLSGKNDAMWPSTLMCEEIIDQLRKEGYRFPYEHVAYECGHNVGSAREHGIKIRTFLREHYNQKKNISGD
jgi:dienelactone hydrolase